MDSLFFFGREDGTKRHLSALENSRICCSTGCQGLEEISNKGGDIAEAMPQLCDEILEVLDRKLQLDDTLRLILAIVGFRLRPLPYDDDDDAAALLHDMIREQAQYDTELLFGKGEDGEKWDVVAKWRIWLIHWGQFFDELAPGELEDGEVLTLEEIAADMDINIIQEGGLNDDADDSGRLHNHDDLLELLCSIQASLIAKVEDLIEPDLQKSHAACTVLNVIRCIAEHPWCKKYELVTAVYLDHITVDARRRHHQIGGTCQKSQVVVEVTDETQETKAVKVLSIVALNALGDQKCLLSMRVCRRICINTAVHERSKIQLADRVAFTFLSFAGRKVLVRGFRTTWPWLVAKSVEKRGAGMPDCDACYYKTLGPGPELFGVVGNSVYVLRPYDKTPQGFHGCSLMSCLASFFCSDIGIVLCTLFPRECSSMLRSNWH